MPRITPVLLVGIFLVLSATAQVQTTELFPPDTTKILNPEESTLRNQTELQNDRFTSRSLISEPESKPTVSAGYGSITLHNMPENATVEVVSITGAFIRKFTVSSSTVNCSIENGMYIVRIVSGQQIYPLKVVVR